MMFFLKKTMDMPDLQPAAVVLSVAALAAAGVFALAVMW